MVTPEEYSRLKQRIEELEEMRHLLESLGSSLNVDEVLKAIVNAVLKLCRAERASIVLFDPSLKTSALTLVRGTSDGEPEIDHRINLLAAAWIEKNAAPLLSDDIVASLNLRSTSTRIGNLGAVLAVPISFQNKTMGIINLVNSKQGSRFDQNALRLATDVAGHAARYIHQAKLHESLFEDNARLKEELQREHHHKALLGDSKQMQTVFQSIALVAPSTATVLLTGETGTGKELVARAIHFDGPRAAKPFIAVNCAAIPAALFESELFGHERGAFTGATDSRKGRFELADAGTLFLDEIGEMPLELQPKLLRVLEERSFSRVGSSTEIQVDVRIIAASSRDLVLAADEGKFRGDLYHRLNVVPIRLPSLRERSADIAILAQSFLQDASGGAKVFAADALEILRQMQWRGNVRELRNIVERISLFVMERIITARELHALSIADHPASDSGINSLVQSVVKNHDGTTDLLETTEKQIVEAALLEAQGNVSEAARLLGIDRKSLERRAEKFGIHNAHKSRTTS